MVGNSACLGSWNVSQAWVLSGWFGGAFAMEKKGGKNLCVFGESFFLLNLKVPVFFVGETYFLGIFI